MKTPWLTSACLNSKSGLPSSVRRLSREPVIRLSIASTRIPRSTSASHRCEPMKPAPPETTALGLVAANAPVGEPHRLHRVWVVDVAAVDDDGPAHRLLDPAEVEVAKLIPLRDHDQRVRAVGDLVGVLEILDLREDGAAPLDGGGVVRAHPGAGRDQHPCDVQAGRLP